MQERQKHINKKANKPQMRKCNSVANSRSNASHIKCNSIDNTSIHQQNNIKYWFDILEGIDAIASKVKQISNQSMKKFMNVRAANQNGIGKKRQNHLYPNQSICATTSLLQSYSNCSMRKEDSKNRNSSKNSRYREEISTNSNANRKSIQKKLNRKESRVNNAKQLNNKAKLRINTISQQNKYKYKDLRQKSKTMQLSNVKKSKKHEKFSTNEQDYSNMNEKECRTQCHKVMQQMHELKKMNEDLKKKNEQLENKLKNQQQSWHQKKYKKNKQNQIILKIINEKNRQENNREYKVVGVEQKSLCIDEPISVTLKSNKKNVGYANYGDILNSNMDSRVHKQRNKISKIDNVFGNSYNKYNEYYGRDTTKGIRKHVSNVQEYISNNYPQYQNQNEQVSQHRQAKTNKYIRYSELKDLNNQGQKDSHNYTFTNPKYRSNKEKSLQKNRIIDLTKQQRNKQWKNNRNNIQMRQISIQSSQRAPNPLVYTQGSLNSKPQRMNTSDQATNNNTSCVTSYDVSNTNSYGVKIKKKPTSMLDLQTQFDRLMQISHLQRNKNRKRVIWDEMKAIANQLKMMRYFTQHQN